MSRKILKASAGTGKTYRLALEYVVSLFKGEKIRDIVVMTFTRKATGEIKDEIISFLRTLSAEPVTDKEIKKKNGTAESIIKIYPDMFSSAEEIFEKAEKAYKEVILNKDNLKIFTIDGLKNNIFKTAIAPMLNINSYDIIDDSQNTEYLKKCFERIFKNKKDFAVMKNFLETNIERDAENYIGVIKNIIDERWKALIIKRAERKPYEINGILNHLDKSLEALESIFEKKGKEGETIKDFIKKDYYPYLEKNTTEEKEKFIYDNWNMIFSSEIKNGRKTASTKKIDVSGENEELAELHEELLKELAKRIYNDTVIEYEKEILNFLEKVYSVYDEIKFREKKFTQQDITNYLLEFMNDKKLNLTNENGITDYMREILESGIKTIFIDEFQDTSVVQWEMLKSMVYSAEKVICVGDEKQSIYGWRGGDKELFENLTEILNGHEETLGVSYRSTKKVTDFTNKFFTDYSSIAKGQGINWNFQPVESSDKENGGYVEIYKSASKDENSLEKITEILKTKFDGNYKETCILARNNATLQEMAEFLAEKNIPYIIETNLDIFSHKTALPIVKLMKYFVYNNKFYLAEFLRDDIILISDKHLKEFLIFKNEDENINKIENFRFSDKELNKFFEKIIEFKNKYQENIFENIDLIPEMIKEFGILNRYTSESDIQNIYNFIAVSKKFANIREFLNEITENSTDSEYKQSSMETENAVTLMTVHKSKGLGFDSVFYIHKETSSKSDSGVQFNISMSKDYKSVENYIIIDGKFEKILGHLDGHFDYWQDKKLKRAEEEINNLYVALTRSKLNLFIIVSKTMKDSVLDKITAEKFFNEGLLEYTNGTFKLNDKKSDEETENTDIIDEVKDKEFDIDFSSYKYDEKSLSENILKLQEEERKYSSEREEKREIGNIVHYFLENLIYNEEQERIEAEKAVVIKYGASFGKDIVINLLRSRGMETFLSENKDIFSKEWDYIQNEYSIYSDEDKQLYRIDRMMMQRPSENKKGRILIVDYKTGSYEEEQLENYSAAVKARLGEEAEQYVIEKKYLKIEL